MTMFKHARLAVLVAAAVFASGALAKSADAGKLGKSLTPVGAERARPVLGSGPGPR